MLVQRERVLAVGWPGRVGLDPLGEADLVVFDQPPRRGDDLSWAAVVMRERVALQPWIGEIEVNHPPDARASPSVQRLVLVADAEQAVLRHGDDAHEQLLGGLDVLVLINQHVVKAACQRRRSSGSQRSALTASSTRSSKS